MSEIWESIKYFIAYHKAASIAVASVVGVAAVGGAGYGVYNVLTDEPEQIVEVEDDYQAEDVYIPEFKNIKISSESLEKDLTIYITDENDQTISGENFSVKMLTPEAAEGLQSYIDAIKAVDDQIAEYTADYTAAGVASEEGSEKSSDGFNADEWENMGSGDDSALPVDGAGIDFSQTNKSTKSDKKATEEKKDDKTEKSAEEESEEIVDSIDSSQVASESDLYQQILNERNVDVTITDEDGNVIETQHSDMSTDPFYLLLLDKETAVQAYTVALNEAEGTVYTDDDADGVITQTDLDAGDYMLCLVNDLDSEISYYEPEPYATAANVKDKVEFKPQKEIKKQIKKDAPKEDGQQKEKLPVEAALKDTVEFVESRKVENGHKAATTTDVVAPKTTAKNSKATEKAGAKLSASRIVKAEANEFTITFKYKLLKEDGTASSDTAKPSKNETMKVAKNNVPEFTPDPTVTSNGTVYELVSSKNPKLEAATKDAEYTYTYQAKKQEETNTGNDNKDNKDDNKQEENKPEDNKQNQGGESGSGTDKPATEEPKPAEPANPPADGEGGGNGQGEQPGDQIRRTHPAYRPVRTFNLAAARGARFAANTNEKKEVATMAISYKEGTFTVTIKLENGAKNAALTVNGGAVAFKDGKATFAATKDGDYAFVVTPEWSNGAATKEELLTATYTVSGFGTATTEQLKDKAGNLLFLDEALTKPATVADYKAGQAYYYKSATYTYYGWQSIDGNTYYFDKNGNRVTGTQVIQGVQYDFGSDGVLIVKGTGIDVSKYQGKIDWKQAKSAVNFAIVRCGYRGMYDGQLHEDPYFYTNMAGAKAAGVNVGVYIYSTALNEAEAVQEASMAVAMAGHAGGCSYPIYIDMEDTTRGQSKLSVDQRMAIVNAFCATVQASGHKAGIYCSKNWMEKRMNASGIPGSCSVWIAQYNTSCTYGGRKNMWQYSSKGSVPGIKGYVDMNKAF